MKSNLIGNKRKAETQIKNKPKRSKLAINTNASTLVNQFKNRLSTNISEDEQDNEITKKKKNNESKYNNDDNNDNELDMLLYKLASLDVNNETNIQRCPVCAKQLTHSKFANHVYECLDKMDLNDRNYVKHNIHTDEQYARRLAFGDGWDDTIPSSECPICGKLLAFGMEGGKNVHINQCLDKQEKQEKNNNNNNEKVEGLSSKQMAACATALLREQKGSKEYEKMLEMFDCLGFNKKNIKSVIKNKYNNNNNNNTNNHNNNNNNNNYHKPRLFKTITDEDIDLNENTPKKVASVHTIDYQADDDDDDDILALNNKVQIQSSHSSNINIPNQNYNNHNNNDNNNKKSNNFMSPKQSRINNILNIHKIDQNYAKSDGEIEKQINPNIDPSGDKNMNELPDYDEL